MICICKRECQKECHIECRGLFQIECQRARQNTYYNMFNPRCYVRNYVRMTCQGGNHTQQSNYLSKFNIGVTAFLKNRNKSGTYDAWCDGAMVRCNGALVRCDGTVRWCDGTVRWCDGTVRWCDGTVRWCDGMVRWCDGTVRWYAIVCDGTQLHAPWGWGGVMVWLHW